MNVIQRAVLPLHKLYCSTPPCDIFFSRIGYFLSQRGIHCRNEFTLA